LNPNLALISSSSDFLASSSPCTRNTSGELPNPPSHFISPFLPAWAEKPFIVWTAALTATVSPRMLTTFAPSTIFLPRVPRAWKPTNITLHSARQRLCFRWWRILPPSHIPLPAMMMLPPFSRLSFIDSSGDLMKWSLIAVSLLSVVKNFLASSSKHSGWARYILVTFSASGLSR